MAKIGHIKVLIIDNHPLFIYGLTALIEKTNRFNVIGSAGNCADALKIAEDEKPKLILLEIRLGDESGLELIPKLKMINPDAVILIISMYEERFYAENVLRLGAKGYVLKTEQPDVVMNAINTVLDNKVYLSEGERERIFQSMAENSNVDAKDWIALLHLLSDRELQIFSFIAKGFGTIEIASFLNLSRKTVCTHKENIKTKLQCNTAQELRQKAIEWYNRSGSL